MNCPHCNQEIEEAKSDCQHNVGDYRVYYRIRRGKIFTSVWVRRGDIPNDQVLRLDGFHLLDTTERIEKLILLA